MTISNEMSSPCFREPAYDSYRLWLVEERLGPAVRFAAWFVIGLNTFFLPLDYWIYPESFDRFVAMRCSWNVSMLAVIVAVRRTSPIICARLGCVVAGLFLIGLSGLGGGVSSLYWPAIMVLFLGMPVLIPIAAADAGIVVFVLTLTFSSLPLVGSQDVAIERYSVSVFFVLAAAIECVVSAAVLDRMRFADFERRADLETARDHLREMDRAKSRFTANIHHELRTPLTMILSPLSALRDGEYGPLPEESDSILRVMEQNARRLLRLINNLLDLAKLESNKIKITRRLLDFRSVAEEIVTGVRPFAERKKIGISVTGFDEMKSVYADRDAIEKVLINLIGNALKFTKANGEIEIRGVAIASGGARVEVRDTGIGIPKEQLDKIFDRFAQVDESATREYEGTGIGLSLACELIELHSGRMWAESEGPGTGTKVCFEIPVGAPDDSERTSWIEEVGEVSPNQGEVSLEVERSVGRYVDQDGNEVSVLGLDSDFVAEIVVAEDNFEMRKLLEFILTKEFRVHACKNGRDALDTVRRVSPDLVVSDVMMPKMSGEELCRALRSASDTSDIPIILLTSKADDETRVRSLESGADDYLTKPFNPRELLARARSFVRIRRLQAELRSRNRILEEALENLESAQLKLVESERRAAVGEIAAGVAHEVNNPVNFALNAARTLRHEIVRLMEEVASLNADVAREGRGLSGSMQTVSDSKYTEDVEDLANTIDELAGIISDGLSRTSRLVGDLRDLSTPDSGDFSEVDICEGIRSTIDLLAPTFVESGVSFRLELKERLPLVHGNVAAINQVVMNLVKNAAQAVEPAGGEVLVRAWEEESFVVLEVEDDGPGLSDSDMEKIFDPFFSTKSAGLGTGLGLSVSCRIVDDHDGEISVRHAETGGCLFEVRIPKSIPDGEASLGLPPVPQAPRG